MVYGCDIGKLVRIKSSGGSQHWMRGKLLDIVSKGRVAVVYPFTHKKPEHVPVERVKIWKAKTP